MDKIKFISMKADGHNDELHSPFIGTSGYYIGSSDQWKDKTSNLKNEVLEQAKTNRLKIKNDLRKQKNSGQITNEEYNSTMSDRGKKAQEGPGTYGRDKATYTVGKGWNQDIKKARSRTGANSKTTKNT